MKGTDEMLRPVHKATVKAAIRKDGGWSGWISASNVNAYHITGGWALGMAVKFTDFGENSDMEQTLADFAHHNCQDAETGYRVRFWES